MSEMRSNTVSPNSAGTTPVGEKGRALYAEKIRPTLTEADKGKYITVHTETGEWLMTENLENHYAKVDAHFGAGLPLYTLRAGYRSIFTFRPGLKLELDEW